MSILDRIKAKIRPTVDQDHIVEAGNMVTTIEPEPEQDKTPTFQMPFSVGDYIPMKGLVLKVDDVDDKSKTLTLKVVGITNSRAKKLGLA